MKLKTLVNRWELLRSVIIFLSDDEDPTEFEFRFDAELTIDLLRKAALEIEAGNGKEAIKLASEALTRLVLYMDIRTLRDAIEEYGRLANVKTC